MLKSNPGKSAEVDADEIKRVQLRQRRTVRETRLYTKVSSSKLPLIYSPNYNIHFFGVEKLHPFDVQKWGNVVEDLILNEVVTSTQLIEPDEATYEDLRVVHTQTYLKSLESAWMIARCIEIPMVAMLPNCLLSRYLLKPMRYQTGGTILAARLALDRRYAINIGGGFHHASARSGGGFCLYADITLAIQYLLISELIDRAMIVDLDAHQGNGHERDFINDERVYIFDMFNYHIYPHDFEAKRAIKRSVRLQNYTEDREYLFELQRNLKDALNEFKPDLIIYNAGTDTLEGDRLGRLSLTSTVTHANLSTLPFQGIVKRDEFVFKQASERQIPIAMVTSGGYLPKSAKVIADSIANLLDKFIKV